MSPQTVVDYELFDADGKQVLFAKTTQDGSWETSTMFDETEARTFVTPGLTLYRRTTTTTFEAL